MNFCVHSLGSGSSGNSMLILGGGSRILLDAGLTTPQLQKRLSKFRLTPKDLNAVFLTHEHGDHSRSAHIISKRYEIPIIANPATLAALSSKFSHARTISMETGSAIDIGELSVQSFSVSHDAADPVGYNVYHKGCKVSFVTDTGVAKGDIARSIEGASLAIIEANHDVERLLSGPYPKSLKTRVLGDKGHLSNEAAADLILEQVETNHNLSCVWLAHLSDTNNSPRTARRYVQQRLSEAGCRNVVLSVAMRNVASLTWRAGAASTQMSLF